MKYWIILWFSTLIIATPMLVLSEIGYDFGGSLLLFYSGILSLSTLLFIIVEEIFDIKIKTWIKK